MLAHELTHVVQQKSARQFQQVNSLVPKIHGNLVPVTAQLKPQLAPPKEMQETINRIEKLIKKKWGKYIDAAKFKSPLRTKVVWYKNERELIGAKIEYASQLAERYIRQGKGKKSLKGIYFRDFLAECLEFIVFNVG